MSPENQELRPGFTPVSDGAFDALDEYVNLLIENPEEAQTKQAEILRKVPEEEKEELSGLMETAASLISAVRSGNFPTAMQIEEAVQKNKP